MYAGSIDESWEDTVRKYDGICDSCALSDVVRVDMAVAESCFSLGYGHVKVYII